MIVDRCRPCCLHPTVGQSHITVVESLSPLRLYHGFLKRAFNVPGPGDCRVLVTLLTILLSGSFAHLAVTDDNGDNSDDNGNNSDDNGDNSDGDTDDSDYLGSNITSISCENKLSKLCAPPITVMQLYLLVARRCKPQAGWTPNHENKPVACNPTPTPIPLLRGTSHDFSNHDSYNDPAAAGTCNPNCNEDTRDNGNGDSDRDNDDDTPPHATLSPTTPIRPGGMHTLSWHRVDSLQGLRTQLYFDILLS
ncbi:hypothetical protein EDB89DRAFT_1900430 [Lactarius sanguifluus]|nr:hypothetical protein EDB89DRAFT_1900430 [Lactarius sanguifluus]